MFMRKHEKWKNIRAEFLPEALEIVEKPISPVGDFIIYSIFVLIILVFAWACVGKIDEVAVARGVFKTTEGVQEIQAVGDGIVTQVNVKEGDFVQKGDCLYSFNKELEKKKLDYSEGNAGILELKIELIDQMLIGKGVQKYREGNYNEEQMDIIEYMIALDEAQKLAIEEKEIAVESAKKQVELAKKGIEGIQNKENYLNEQKDIAQQVQDLGSVTEIELEILETDYANLQDEISKMEKLYNLGAKSKSELEELLYEKDKMEKQIEIKRVELENNKLSNDLDNSAINYEVNQNKEETVSLQATISAKESEYEAALVDLENEKTAWETKLLDLKQQNLEELNQYEISIDEQYFEYEHKEVLAPYDGIIKTLEVNKEGAFVMSTQVLAEILPDTEQIVVEAQVNNSDIGFVEIGQQVDIKVDTYDYQQYGKLQGEIVYISPDSIENEKMEKVYKVHVLVDDKTIKNKEKVEISQGMECSVEIKTGKRKIIAFFLEPLVDALDNSLGLR